MDKADRWREIERRRLRLSIPSARKLAELAKVSRGALDAAKDGTASDQTYDRLEAFLDNYVEETGEDDTRVVTFKIEGNFGIRVAVSGPVENLAELEAAVERLVRGMGEEARNGNETPDT